MGRDGPRLALFGASSLLSPVAHVAAIDKRMGSVGGDATIDNA